MKHKRTETEALRVVAFLAKLRANWGKRFSDDATEQEWLNMMIHELGGFSEEVLTRAATALMRSKVDFFPRMQQCVDACAAAYDDVRRSSPDFFKKDLLKKGGDQNYSLAWELLRSPEGRRAAHDKWAYGFWMFVVRNGRVPDPSECAKVQASARRVAYTVEAMNVRTAAKTPIASHLDLMLLDFGTALHDRNAKLEVYALGTRNEALDVLASMPVHSRWMHPASVAS